MHRDDSSQTSFDVLGSECAMIASTARKMIHDTASPGASNADRIARPQSPRRPTTTRAARTATSSDATSTGVLVHVVTWRDASGRSSSEHRPTSTR